MFTSDCPFRLLLNKWRLLKFHSFQESGINSVCIEYCYERIVTGYIFNLPNWVFSIFTLRVREWMCALQRGWFRGGAFFNDCHFCQFKLLSAKRLLLYTLKIMMMLKVRISGEGHSSFSINLIIHEIFFCECHWLFPLTLRDDARS